MGVRIEKTDLPGIGVRHDLVTARGRRIGVVTYRDGSRELSIFDIEDPDACAFSIPMSDAEAATLSDILGASFMLSKLTELTDEAAGLFTEHCWSRRTRTMPAARSAPPKRAAEPAHPSLPSCATSRSSHPPHRMICSRRGLLVAVGTRHGLDTLADLIASSKGERMPTL